MWCGGLAVHRANLVCNSSCVFYCLYLRRSHINETFLCVLLSDVIFNFSKYGRVSQQHLVS